VQEDVERKRDGNSRIAEAKVIEAHLVGACAGWLAAWLGYGKELVRD
jgi:hypothetical protein